MVMLLWLTLHHGDTLFCNWDKATYSHDNARLN
jgi:hypothetical protein